MKLFKSSPTSAAPVRTTVIGLVLLIILALVLMLIQLYLAAGSVDKTAYETQIRVAENELQELLEQIPRDQRSVSLWDEAVQNSLINPDLRWLDENMVTWAHDYFGHDEIYILNGADALLIGYAKGTVLRDDADGRWLAPFRSLVGQLRQKFASAGGENVQLYGFMKVRDELAIASIAPIIPSSDRLSVPKKPAVYISVRYLNPALGRLRNQMVFQDASAVAQAQPTEGRAVLPLRGTDGAAIGYFAWSPFTPGWQMIVDSLPVLFGAGLLFILVGWLGGSKMIQQSTELAAREAQARHLAFHDVLTGLANRALLMERIQAALHQASAGEQSVLYYVDLDHFKNVNDSLGHAAGDDLLREVARRLEGLLGPADMAARLGGDEFVILQRGITDPDQVHGMARRIVQVLSTPVMMGSTKLSSSGSLGVALSAGVESAAELLRRADIALYRSKMEGRRSYRIFAPDMDDAVQQRRELEADLAAALADGTQLALAYQPLYAAGSNKIEGVEALVRWTHPTKGNLPPSLFIQIAEESGLIVPLGEWVLREACRQVAAWGPVYVAVNVSPVQFRQPSFADTVEAALRESGLRPAQLELEITEGVLADKNLSVTAIAALHSLGVKVALDDFGTGYSSLSYLRQLEVDKIKIDQSFVKQAADDEGARSIIIAMVQLAAALNVEVTAEGVETNEQRAFLTSIGCDHLQGYLMSRPLTASQMADLLTDKKAAV